MYIESIVIVDVLVNRKVTLPDLLVAGSTNDLSFSRVDCPPYLPVSLISVLNCSVQLVLVNVSVRSHFRTLNFL